jgi:hypothetical protein
MKKIDLNNDKITTGFKTPDNYFADFSTKMMNQIQEEKEVKVVSFWSSNKSWIYATAAIIVLAFSIPVFNSITTKNELSDENQITAYLADESNLTDDHLIELLTLDEIKSMDVNTNYDSNEIEKILSEESNLEQYITN